MCDFCNKPYEDMSKSENQSILQAVIPCAQIQAVENMGRQIALFGIALCAEEIYCKGDFR